VREEGPLVLVFFFSLFCLLPKRFQPRKQSFITKYQNTQWNDKTKHAFFTPNFCIYAPKELQVSQLSKLQKQNNTPKDTNSLLIYHHQIHPNPMMQKDKKNENKIKDKNQKFLFT
jgi:hypothetical protein